MLIDELDTPRGWDRATVIHPRSIEIFEALGIADGFLAESARMTKARFHSGGEVLGELDLALVDSPYKFDLQLSEEKTEGFLADYLESLGGSVTRGTRLAGFDQGPEGIAATLERDGSTFEVQADWLVGCDGLQSVVRDGAGIDFPGSDIQDLWAVFDAAVTGWDREYDVGAVFLDTPPVILMPMPGERWRIYMRPSSNESDLVAEATEVLHRYMPNSEFTGVENPARFRCHSRVAATYRSGRVLLAGDAAHVCTPAEGHGMNTGLQDAFNLGWKLALVCKGAAGEGLLDTYEIERRPVAERVVASGADAEAGQTLTEVPARVDRDAGIRTAYSDPETAHHEAVAAAEIDRDYGGSPIVAGSPEARVPPGRLLPDTEAARHPTDGSGPLHAFGHRPGHTVMVLGGPGADPTEVARLVAELESAHGDSPAVEAVLGFSTGAGEGRVGTIHEGCAELLGIEGVTVLAIRPDRYIGLRHDGGDPEPVARYLEALER